jgi:hypothetical protein
MHQHTHFSIATRYTDMPFCPQCGVDNPPSARFCDQCGAQLIPVPAAGTAPVAVAPLPSAAPAAPATPAAPTISAGPSVCPQCGTAVIPGEAFCDSCGAALISPQAPVAAPAAPTLPYAGVPPQPSYPAPVPVAAPPQAAPVVSPPAPVVSPPAPVITPPAPVVSPPAPATARSALAPGRLILQPGGVALNFPAAAEAVVGRADPVSNFTPTLDLGPYGALENGVGRRHVRIFVQQGGVFVEDLDSTNGSFLNNTRLTPRQPQPLRTGDELRVGTLKLRVEL